VTELNSRRIAVVMGVWLSCSAATDIMIAVCMTYHLSIRDTGFPQTHALVSKLTRLIIETGSLTAVVALTTLILFFVFPGHLYYSTTAVILPMMYGNTILVVLNSRFDILGGRSTYKSAADVIISTSGFPRDNGTSSGPFSTHPGPVIAIRREMVSDSEAGGHLEMKPVHGSRDDGAYE